MCQKSALLGRKEAWAEARCTGLIHICPSKPAEDDVVTWAPGRLFPVPLDSQTQGVVFGSILGRRLFG